MVGQSVDVGDWCRPSQNPGCWALAEAGVEKVLSDAEETQGDASWSVWYSDGGL